YLLIVNWGRISRSPKLKLARCPHSLTHCFLRSYGRSARTHAYRFSRSLHSPRSLGSVRPTARGGVRRVGADCSMSMPIQNLYIGMEVRHPQYGVGAVKALTELTADISVDNARRRVAASSAELT